MKNLFLVIVMAMVSFNAMCCVSDSSAVSGEKPYVNYPETKDKKMSAVEKIVFCEKLVVYKEKQVAEWDSVIIEYRAKILGGKEVTESCLNFYTGAVKDKLLAEISLQKVKAELEYLKKKYL